MTDDGSPGRRPAQNRTSRSTQADPRGTTRAPAARRRRPSSTSPTASRRLAAGADQHPVVRRDERRSVDPCGRLAQGVDQLSHDRLFRERAQHHVANPTAVVPALGTYLDIERCGHRPTAYPCAPRGFAAATRKSPSLATELTRPNVQGPSTAMSCPRRRNSAITSAPRRSSTTSRAGFAAPRIERTRKVLGVEHRRVDRVLQVEPAMHHAQEERQAPLILLVAARSAKRHPRRAVA